LAQRFSVSRAQVLIILRDAEQNGLAAPALGKPAGPRGGYRATPLLADALQRFIAVMFLIQLDSIAVAEAITPPTAQDA
jgi:hypothetical protein